MPTPPITSFSAYHGGWDVAPWCKPFKKLLVSLRIIDREDPEALEEQSFCFQHTHDLSELSRVFLSVYTSSPHFEYHIDIESILIHNPKWSLPKGSGRAAKLKAYADRVLKRVQDYSNTLIEYDVIHDTSPFVEVNLLTCPLCRSPLRSCSECDATVACSNMDCAGSQVVDCEQCEEHATMVCHECLDSEDQDTIPSFARCPACNSWCCSYDVDWCPGRIIHPEPGTEELAELFHERLSLGGESIVRSHSPMPGPCRSCVDSAHVDAWQGCSRGGTPPCPNNATCLIHYSVDAAYCPECITEHEGQCCTCGSTWLCDTCSVVDSSHDPRLISCRRCGGTYCKELDGCQYCPFCAICGRGGVCVGCQVREKGDVGGKGELSQLVHTNEQCVECKVGMCNECCLNPEHGIVQCSGCHHWICYGCTVRRGDWCRSCRDEVVE